jgi:5-methylcytosine-specific restriction endonuclease McrBC regulatory subunit McrC
VFSDGLAAIDWTVEERGLGGVSELSGLAWRLDMESFFEAWVETLAERAARRFGAQPRAGRTSATKVPLDWRPPGSGSQRSLIPDVVMQRSDVVVVLDAKYKRHAQEIERLGWARVDESMREQHRNDVLQALAYSTLFDSPRVVACLVYPAAPDVWQGLVDRGRDCARARVRCGARHVELALLAVPMGPMSERACGALASLLNTPV